LTFDVSRITARRALEEMERNGFVTRLRGKGTYVARQPETPGFPKFTGALDQLFMVGKAAVVKEANVEQVPPPSNVRTALQLGGSDTTVTRIQRVLLLNGKPHTYHQNFYPQSIGRKIKKEDVLRHSLLELLEKRFAKPIIEVHQIIEATVADTELADRLEISFGSPVLYVARTLLGQKGAPIGFTQAYYRGDSYRLSVTLVRKGMNRSKSWRSSAYEKIRPGLARTK